MPTVAQKLRRNPTSAEIRFWRLIAPLRAEWHFRKQVQMGPYVVDFVSHKARLVVEIDGDTHFVGDGPVREAVRDAELQAGGYRVLRFTNGEVMGSPDGVWTGVVEALGEGTTPSERR
jgi:very-short-patch-repair endonuclease